jgi:hypothetical protein
LPEFVIGHPLETDAQLGRVAAELALRRIGKTLSRFRPLGNLMIDGFTCRADHTVLPRLEQSGAPGALDLFASRPEGPDLRDRFSGIDEAVLGADDDLVAVL